MDMREDGVVTVRMHCQGGQLIWSMELHDAIGKMWRMLVTNRETERGCGQNLVVNKA